jgi:menaquinol-cytochrome c reductase iron-sulfur subunit
MSGSELSRRQFARLGTVAAGAVVAGALVVPIGGFLLSPLFVRGDRFAERRVGDISGLPDGVPQRFVVDFPENAWGTQQLPYTVWVVRLGERLKVLSNICTHMQCAVRFETQINQFLCPCHGGLYAPDGTNVGGPPPKPLSEYQHRLDGSVLYVTNRLTEQL